MPRRVDRDWTIPPNPWSHVNNKLVVLIRYILYNTFLNREKPNCKRQEKVWFTPPPPSVSLSMCTKSLLLLYIHWWGGGGQIRWWIVHLLFLKSNEQGSYFKLCVLEGEGRTKSSESRENLDGYILIVITNSIRKLKNFIKSFEDFKFGQLGLEK